MYVANVGNTRVVVLRKGNKVEALTVDHTTESEQEMARIEGCGEKVIRNKVRGQIPVSRSIGDPDIKAITCIPAIRVLDKRDIELMVFCNRGVWMHKDIDPMYDRTT